MKKSWVLLFLAFLLVIDINAIHGFRNVNALVVHVYYSDRVTPLSGAVVKLYEMVGDRASYLSQARTDSRGKASFANLPNGEYAIEVVYGGRIVFPKSAGRITLDKGLIYTLKVYTILSKTTPTEREEVVTEGNTLILDVFSSDGVTPLSGALVNLYRDGQLVGTRTTDTGGRVVFFNLPSTGSGEYYTPEVIYSDQVVFQRDLVKLSLSGGVMSRYTLVTRPGIEAPEETPPEEESVPEATETEAMESTLRYEEAAVNITTEAKNILAQFKAINDKVSRGEISNSEYLSLLAVMKAKIYDLFRRGVQLSPSQDRLDAHLKLLLSLTRLSVMMDLMGSAVTRELTQVSQEVSLLTSDLEADLSLVEYMLQG